METLYCKTTLDWQAWLSEHHDCETEIWLVFYKKATGKSTISYSDALDEALCYGWVDSLIKKIDEEKYARKFTPRKIKSKWSEVNKKKVEKLIAANRMTQWGLAKVDAAKKNGMWDKPDRPEISLETPQELEAAFEHEPEAKAYFESLAPSHRKQYIAWIATAKRAETKANRIEKSIRMLKEKQKLGMI